VNTLTAPAPNDALVSQDSERVDQLIARVLRRTHRRMEALNSPNEARAILYAAHSFADELSMVDSRFDRVQFIKDATEDPS
jgi:hypothetical protein